MPIAPTKIKAPRITGCFDVNLDFPLDDPDWVG